MTLIEWLLLVALFIQEWRMTRLEDRVSNMEGKK